VCVLVSCGKLIKQAVAAHSSIGLECKEYADQKQPGNSFFTKRCKLNNSIEC